MNQIREGNEANVPADPVRTGTAVPRQQWHQRFGAEQQMRQSNLRLPWLLVLWLELGKNLKGNTRRVASEHMI